MNEEDTLLGFSKQQYEARDVFGRTIIHICVLFDAPRLLRAALAHPHGKLLIFATDYENGWNVLHYIFHYKRLRCLNVLLRHIDDSVGTVNILQTLLKTKDRANLPPMSLVDCSFKNLAWVPEYINEKNEFHLVERFGDSRKQVHDWWMDERCGSDYYVMGTNSNNNLGVGDSTNRQSPNKLPRAHFGERFKKAHITKYFSAVVTASGRLYTCGVGAKGRLGTGSTSNCFLFKPVDIFVREIAVSNAHTVALTDQGVFAWGLNDFCQIAQEKDHYNVPKHIGLKNIIGVACSKIHSMAFTSDSIYFWGLNIGQVPLPNSGELDHRVNGTFYKGCQVSPTLIPLKFTIKRVATCEMCTIILSDSNELLAFHNGQKLRLPKLPPLVPSDFDKFVPSSLTKVPVIKDVSMKSHENVHLLTESGEVVHFALAPKPTYTYVWKPFDVNMKVVDIDTSNDGSLVLCTSSGSVFVSQLPVRRGSVTQTMPVLPTLGKKKYAKVETLNHIVRVTCDDSFTSFGFIRDDVDPLPLKLQKNDFFEDIKYLSILKESDLYRKQDALLDVDHDLNSYVACPLYFDNEENELAETHDAMWNFRASRFHTKRPPFADTYLQLESAFSVLENEATLRAYLALDADVEKFYDAQIMLADSTTIGFHTRLFEQRSNFFARLLSGGAFDVEGFEGEYERGTKALRFHSNVDLRALVVFHHFMYTNKMLSDRKHLPETRSDISRLISLFQVSHSVGKSELFASQLSKMGEQEAQDGDVLVVLRDGEFRFSSSTLVARSAFFETILSRRWDLDSGDKLVTLDIDQEQFAVIMRHLHGCNDMELFSDYDDADDFVNFLLGLVKVADELLLVAFKHLCELKITSFLTLDNCLVLLAHAYALEARKLFQSCCWYIYNNMDVLMFDPLLRTLEPDLVAQLERQIAILQMCKGPLVRDELGGFRFPLEDKSHFATQFVLDREGYTKAFMNPPFAVLVDAPPEKRRLRRLSQKPVDLSELTKQMRAMSMSGSAIEDDAKEVSGSEPEVAAQPRSERPQTKTRSPEPKPEKTGPKPETSESMVWGSRNSSSSSVARLDARLGPKLGEAPEKAARVRFSVKTQKKKVLDLAPEPAPAPWLRPGTSSSPKPQWAASLPVLGTKKKEKKKPSEVWAAPEPVRRPTLAEIKKEQEFAKWWEEESRRVRATAAPRRNR